MTDTTEKERAEFEVEFERLYEDWVFGSMPKSAAKRAALLVWQAARRAPVVRSVELCVGGVIRGEPSFAKPPAPKASPKPPEK